MRSLLAILCCLACTSLLIGPTLPAFAQQNGSWTADSDGNWSDTTKWSGGLVATGATYSATFNMNITANRTVTLDTNVTIGTVLFGDTGGNELWTLRTLNSSVLTMDNGASKPKIRAVQGGNGFRCNVVIAGTNGFRGPDTASGVLALGAANTYTGDTEIDRNILKLNLANAIPSGSGYGNVMMLANVGNPGDTSKLDLNTFSPTINGLNSDFDPVANPNYYNAPYVYSTASAGGALTLTVGAGDANGEFGGIIQNGANRVIGLTKTGNGTQTLTNANTYTGATTIGGGTLNFAVAGACAGSPITVGASGTLRIQQATADTTWTGKSITFNSGTLTIDLGSNPISSWAAPVTFTQGVTIGATPAISITGPTIANGTYPLIAYTTSLTGGGLLPDTVSLPGGGFGTLQDNTGTLTIDLVVGGPLPPAIHWAAGNGTWDTSAFNWKGAIGSTNYVEGVPVQFKDIDATGNPVVTLNSSVQPASVLINATKNYTLTGSGSIDGSASLTKVGTGALTLDLASSFTGGAAISQGTVNIKNASAFGSTAGTLTILGGTLDNTSAGPLTLFDYPQSWNGDFAFTGSGDLNLGVGNILLGSSRIITVNNGTLTVGGNIQGTGLGLTKAGPGTLVLASGLATSSGGTLTVNAGTVQLGYLTAGNIFNGETRLVGGALILTDSLALRQSTLNMNATDAGSLSFGALTTATLGSLKGSRNLTLENGSSAPVELRVGNANGASDTYSGFLGGTGSLTKVGTGTWQLGSGGAGGGTYSGDTTITAGTLQPGANNIFPHGAGKGNLVIQSAGTYDFLDRIAQTINGLVGSGTINSSDIGGLGSPNQTFTLGDGDANGNFNGTIHEVPKGGKTPGTMSLVKIGTGTQVLAYDLVNGRGDTYSGNTTINGGTLQVDTVLYETNDVPGTVTVNATGTLDGSGTIRGPVVANAGGAVGAGASVGLLTLEGGLDLSGGGINIWELAAERDDSDGGPGSDFDLISVNGGVLTLGGSSTLAIRFIDAASSPNSGNPFWTNSHTWMVISAPVGVSTTFATVENAIYGNGTFSTSAAAGDRISLIWTPGTNLTPVTNFSIGTGPGAGQMTLSYSGGSGSQFVLVGTNNVAAPLANWTRLKTNSSSPGSFTITPGSDPREFYRVKSE